MSFPTLTVTDGGRGLLLAAMNQLGGTSHVVKFTRVKIGNGTAPENIRAMTQIVNELDEAPITNFERGTNSVTVTFLYDNSDVATAFYWKEVGLLARLDNDASTETLFAYTNAGNDAEKVPAATGAFYEENTYKLEIIVDNTQDLAATVKSLTYATKEDLDNHIQTYGQNVHHETAMSIGLGNVPNVTTNNQTPTWTMANLLTPLHSGEKLTTLMGKIARAVLTVIDHVNARGNVHGVSAADIGAAEESHTHAASDITSGVLSNERGGTGKSIWAIEQIVSSDHAGRLSQLRRPYYFSVLTQTSEGPPTWVNMEDLAESVEPYIEAGGLPTGFPDAIGWYEGDNGTNRMISLGFTPSAVYVTSVNIGSARDNCQSYYFEPGKNIYHSGCGTSYYTTMDTEALIARNHGCACVVNGGFKVQHDSESLDYINATGERYLYMAWK
mgnify:CR=1 FL=1